LKIIGGGGSSLGAAAVTRAQPDGYTILLGGTQTHVNEALLKSRPLYDPVKDLDPIVSVASYFLGIAVHPAVPVQNLKELIAYARSNPGKLSYGHAGVGTIQHLTGELFKSLTETRDIVQVPYRGTGPAIADLISGQVPMGIVGVTGQVLELHRSGKMRVLAVTGPKRLLAAPEAMEMAAGLWKDRGQRLKPVHQPRHRRDCVGELIQIDGSNHWWFEARGPRCTLLVYIDDSTSRLMHLQFVETESTFDYFVLRRAAYSSAMIIPSMGGTPQLWAATLFPTSFVRAIRQRLDFSPCCQRNCRGHFVITFALNERGVRPARGTRWYVSSVSNLLARAQMLAQIREPATRSESHRAFL
jgi:hypothetical protein